MARMASMAWMAEEAPLPSLVSLPPSAIGAARCVYVKHPPWYMVREKYTRDLLIDLP